MTTEARYYQHSDDLQCDWSRWTVVDPSRLVLHVGPGHCTDMTGAIRVGLRLMPEVQEITVCSGDVIDIVYRRDHAGWFTDSARWSNGRRLVIAEQEQFTQPQG